MTKNEVTTRITGVTVYTDRAQITRQGKLTLESGVQEILVGALPATLDAQSLRATGRGEIAVKIIGVEASSRIPVKPSNVTQRELQEQLDAIQDAGTAIAKNDSILAERAEAVKALSQNAAIHFAKTLSDGTGNLENATKLLDYVAAELKSIDEARTALEIQKRENAAKQMAINSRLKQLQGNRSTPERIVVVLVEANGTGEWELELSYVVSGAKWLPTYDARVQMQSEAGRFSLSYNALITQRSGDNWENVSLKLSTAQPGRGTLPPKLEAIWIDQPRPMAVASAACGSSMSDNYEAIAYAGETSGMLESLRPIQQLREEPEKKRMEAENVVADVSTEGATVEFSLPHLLSVPSDGQPHRVSIATREFPAKFDYVAIPRLIEIAYLRAKVKNDAALSLLAGEVNIFRDDVFVGRSQLGETAPNAELTLFLGPDEGVRAKREMLKREVDKNFIGSSRRIHFSYQIEIQNLKNHAVIITVQDQIPVSRSESIKVKLRGSQPEAKQNDLGILNWEWMQSPNEKRGLRFDYGVEGPREMIIHGLSD
jgi:uncharacterized protein (TIGR02231 family)